MANLIPSEYQKSMMRLTRARFIFAGSVVLLASALIALIALLPSYLGMRFGVPMMPPSSSAHSSVAASPDRVQIQEAQSLVLQLNPFVAATTTPMQVILAALSAKPAGVSVQHIAYSAASGAGAAQLIFSGTAKSPDLINTYRTTLSENPRFSSVSVPLGALVGNSAGTFTLTLSGTF